MPEIPHPCSLEGCQHFRQEAGRHPRPHTIMPYREVVEVVTGGHGWVRDGEDWHEVMPGDLLWHAAGDETIGRADFDNPYRCLAVHFRVRRAKGMGVRRFSKWPDVEEINVLAAEAPRLMWEEGFDRAVLRDYLFSRLLFQVRLYERASRLTAYPEPVRMVLARIERDFALPLRLEDLASEAGWSAPHLHAEFRRHLQTTPHRALLQKRLRVAKERLVSSWEPVKQVAVECGFSDMAAFAHAFKAHTGQTPREYRDYHLRRG